jgi:hypothetical protein
MTGLLCRVFMGGVVLGETKDCVRIVGMGGIREIWDSNSPT